MQCVIHGSFRKSFDEIADARKVFESAGIRVLAPTEEEIVGVEDGFVKFAGQEEQDPRQIELLYLHHLKRMGGDGFSYFVNPDGLIGRSASYELGIAQATNVPCYFMAPLMDHPAYVRNGTVMAPETLAAIIRENDALPKPAVPPNEMAIHRLWEELLVPGSIVAAGAIIEYDDGRTRDRRDILMVKTHKWNGRWSVVGGKVRRNETLVEGLSREVREETGLSGTAGKHLITFDQIKDSGYYRTGINHIFADFIFKTTDRHVRLNDEAQDFAWVDPIDAYRNMHVEPNARHLLRIYLTTTLKAHELSI